MNYKLIFLLTFVSLFLSGCVTSESPDINRLVQNELIEDEMEKYINVILSDGEKLDDISNDFYLYDQSITNDNNNYGIDITTNDIYQLTSLMQEYCNQYNLMYSHLNTLNNHVTQNKNQLNRAGYDVFEINQGINDVNIESQNEIRRMESRIKYLITYMEEQEQYNRAQQEELESILKMLFLLV